MRHYWIVFAWLFGGQLYAGNTCGTATALGLYNGAGACPAPAVFSFGVACSATLPAKPGCVGAATCAEQMWFRFSPGDPLLQYDVRFELSFDFTAVAGADVRYYLLYAESLDSGNGDPCAWINTDTPPFTMRQGDQYGCWNIAGGAVSTQSFEAYGLDGTATYFLVLDRVTGAGGSASVCARQLATGAAPANDRCSAATVLADGSGIDTQAATGGAGSWADALGGTIRYARKQRMQNECIGGTSGHTEDHYYEDLPSCYSNHCLGDGQVPIFPPVFYGDCVESLESTVWYSFQRPPLAPADDWYVHIGATQCTGTPDSIEVIVASVVDCATAENTVVLACAQVHATGLYPTADHTFGPFTLDAISTYGIIVDGVHGAQCDFDVLLTRSLLNPVLPAGFVRVTGQPGAGVNELRWRLDAPANYTQIGVERSRDGVAFDRTATLPAATQHWTDTQAPGGLSYYRLRALDHQGGEHVSEVVFIEQPVSDRLLGAYPLPMTAVLHVVWDAPEAGYLSLDMTDLAGRRVYTGRQPVAPGEQTLAWPVADLPAGLYLLQLRQGAFQRVLRVMK